MSKVVIICSPRTGSTSLVSVLAKTFDFEDLKEIFNPRHFDLPFKEENYPYSKKDLSSYLRSITSENKQIMRIHTNQVCSSHTNLCDPKDLVDAIYETFEDPYVIYLQRSDSIEQILSLYVALNRNIWHTDYIDESHIPDKNIDIGMLCSLSKSVLDSISKMEEVLQDKDILTLNYDSLFSNRGGIDSKLVRAKIVPFIKEKSNKLIINTPYIKMAREGFYDRIPNIKQARNSLINLRAKNA